MLAEFEPPNLIKNKKTAKQKLTKSLNKPTNKREQNQNKPQQNLKRPKKTHNPPKTLPTTNKKLDHRFVFNRRLISAKWLHSKEKQVCKD